MKVLFTAAEAAPFIKTGGLGDVVGSLPKALKKEGLDVCVILPKYGIISSQFTEQMKYITNINVQNSWRTNYCGIFMLVMDGVRFYFLDNEQYFHRKSIYGAYDEGEIFSFFSRAVLEVLPIIDFVPDIIHVHDWHTAILPVYLNAFYRDNPFYQNIRTVLSIHNIEFQGKFNPYNLGQLFGLDESWKPYLEYNNDINLLKSGIEAVNLVLTVSEAYAEEIKGPLHSHGLHHILNARKNKVFGIINGIDTSLYNPETDPNLKLNYSSLSLENKKINKLALQNKLGLNENAETPLVCMVTRLTKQKGLELFYPVMEELSFHNLQLIILGTGEEEFENFFRYWEWNCHEKIRAYIKFDNNLSSAVYGGSDFLLMPSKSEPCGISQMIAMRYGTVPIVHTVGGLKDTVKAYNPLDKTGTGVTFQSFNSYDMLNAILRALDLYSDKEHYNALRKNAMAVDFGWKYSAEKYINAYNSIL